MSYSAETQLCLESQVAFRGKENNTFLLEDASFPRAPNFRANKPRRLRANHSHFSNPLTRTANDSKRDFMTSNQGQASLLF